MFWALCSMLWIEKWRRGRYLAYQLGWLQLLASCQCKPWKAAATPPLVSLHHSHVKPAEFLISGLHLSLGLLRAFGKWASRWKDGNSLSLSPRACVSIYLANKHFFLKCSSTLTKIHPWENNCYNPSYYSVVTTLTQCWTPHSVPDMDYQHFKQCCWVGTCIALSSKEATCPRSCN